MGGLAPLVRNPDEVYRKLYSKLPLTAMQAHAKKPIERVSSRNRDYYRRFPEDVDRVRSLVKFIAAETPDLPAGGKLSVERFQALGLSFGAHGGADAVHEIVFRAYNEYTQLGFLTTSTLSSIEGSLHFDSNLLYAVLHEPIYCQGMAPNWSAERVKKELPQFNWQSAMASKDPVFFTGEMIYPWMFESFPELRKLKETASIVASFEDWPELYDEEQLAKNNVPVYSATYVDDMFVDFEFAQETASKIKGCKQFITNMMYHDAIRSKADEVMKQLFTLRDDVID
ncbi:MAG: hypothetical protein M1819_002706 [Sarea resinae]|nr:MAG: hypothetical protein M1819_002706 [Sarea resinae]